MIFYKYHGTGNDFIFVEDIDERRIPNICHRHFGVGADGLMKVEASEIADVKMRYFNQDGSRAKMCGNGLRCFARHVHETNQVGKEVFTVETDAGIFEVGVEKGYDAIWMRFSNEASGILRKLPLEKETVEAIEISMGADHLVVLGDASQRAELLCHHAQYPSQINVNFVRLISRDQIEVRTFERGVGWTLSCGTGVMASALAMYQRRLCDHKVEALVPGGKLFVAIEGAMITLIGPAVKIAKGWYEDEII